MSEQPRAMGRALKAYTAASLLIGVNYPDADPSAFAPLADVAKAGDGAKSALRLCVRFFCSDSS